MSIRTSLITASLLSAMSVPAFAGEEVKIGVPSWTGAQAIAHLLGAVVEMRIGGTVEYVPGNNATIFQGMDQGKGDIDVHPDVWLPNQESFTKKYVDGAGSVTLSSNPYEGNQGFCVSSAFRISGNSPSNCTSTTAPITWLILPVPADFCSAIILSSSFSYP